MDDIKCEDCDSGRNIRLETTGRDDGGFTRPVDCGVCPTCKGSGYYACCRDHRTAWGKVLNPAAVTWEPELLCEECLEEHNEAEKRAAKDMAAEIAYESQEDARK